MLQYLAIPFWFKRALRLSARDFCMKFYTFLRYLFSVIRNAFQKSKNTEVGFKKEKIKTSK